MVKRDMANKKDEYTIAPAQISDLEAIHRVDESRFTSAMDEVVKEAEAMRFRYMKRHQSRRYLVMTVGMMAALAGAGGFGWFFLVKFNLGLALLCMIPALGVPLVMRPWAEAPVKNYIRDYKNKFMPKMAEALGGFKFMPEGGISRDILGKTGVVPAHDIYNAEDCFRGVYKGVKVIFSEGRLYKRSSPEPVFQGIFVVLETPHKIIDGHTIITADRRMAQQSAATRWAKLKPVPVRVENPDWDRFVIFSDKPEDAALLVGEKLLKELAEAADVFHKAELTAVLFRSKYIFMMIPHKGDMFEPSSMFAPVATKRHAEDCKKEIERILEIIDIFEIYKGGPGQL